MASPLEDYALIGDGRAAGLVGRDGSIDWLCLPRFDSDACFAALLGDAENGFWRIAPLSPVKNLWRAYRGSTLTVETEIETEDGTVVVIDFLAIEGVFPDVVRIVVGKSGSVPMHLELAIRCGYGYVVPWVRRVDGGILAIAGPDQLRLTSPVRVHGQGMRTVGDFVVRPGDRVPFVLSWSPSHLPPPIPVDAEDALARCDAFFGEWSRRIEVEGPYAEIIKRSLLTLKALIYAPTGGIVAAPTTSLPERLGGVRNWDYRYCWLRDATFTLYALMNAGYREEAREWRDWLLRVAAGAPAQLQVLYGVGGERRLTESELDWLAGYDASRPVRIGNAATNQRQLDVYGELIDTFYVATELGLPETPRSWAIGLALLGHLENVWREPDHGIWEVRGPPRNFTYSKVMCWVAFDRAIRTAERLRLAAPIDRWTEARNAVHAEVCANAFDPALGSFVQSYGSQDLDASLLLMLQVGFLPPEDPRMIGTVEAIERHLVRDGLVDRYRTRTSVDGLPEGEGAFIPCSFWLADALVLLGRSHEARALFERLLGLASDVGLVSEEYDRSRKRLTGNFPQALSHVALINTAINLSRSVGPARHRRRV